MMGLSTKIVHLRLMLNETTLVYDDKTRAEPTEILLSEIKKMNLVSLKAFEVVCEGGRSFVFEADSSSTQKAWMEALSLAVAASTEPSLRERVDDERRLRIEAVNRAHYKSLQQHNSANASAAAFKLKYGLNSKQQGSQGQS
jgi:hypothetical protein